MRPDFSEPVTRPQPTGLIRRQTGMLERLARLRPERIADLDRDFLKFLTSQENGKKIITEAGFLSSVNDTLTGEAATPQMQDALELIQQTSTFAVWLDTAAHAKVASAYLAGAQALIDGTKTPEQVMTDVKQASEQAKQEG